MDEPQEHGFLEIEGDVSHTSKLKQSQIKKHIAKKAARQIFNIDLKEGPYKVKYDYTGTHMILGGEMGHMGLIRLRDMKLLTEPHTDSKIRDICFLHNHTMFACIQNKEITVFDDHGLQIHNVDGHKDATCLEYLHHHWLLASIGYKGELRYLDTSMGKGIGLVHSKKGACSVMRQNPRSAIIHLGHTDGDVSLCTPAAVKPIQRIFCHRGAVTALAVSRMGDRMATAGTDNMLKLWDLRSTARPLKAYKTVAGAVVDMDFSQRDLLSVGYGAQVHVWGPEIAMRGGAAPHKPYMQHLYGNRQRRLASCRFRPFQDALSLGLTSGVQSIVVPGSGDPEFDSFASNIYATAKHRSERVVKQLLEKLPWELIGNPEQLFTLKQRKEDTLAERAEAQRTGNVMKDDSKKKHRKSRANRKWLVKQQERRPGAQAAIDAAAKAKKAGNGGRRGDRRSQEPVGPFERFSFKTRRR